MLTATERTFLLDHLAGTRDAFAAALQTCDAELWAFRPTPDSWSTAECAEHIATVERQITLVLKRLGDAPPKETVPEIWQRKNSIILTLNDRARKIEAPASLHPTGHYSNAADCLEAFLGFRKEMIEIVDRDSTLLHGRLFAHPFLKELDGYQWLLTASVHVERHTAQLAEIRSLRASRVSE